MTPPRHMAPAPRRSAILLLTVLLLLSSSRSEAAIDGLLKALNMIPLSRDPAPEFVLPMYGGKQVRLADFRGSVVFLNFWGTYCPPCRAEMQSIQDLQQHFHEDDLVVLAISVGESEKTVKGYLSSNPFTFLILLDERKSVAQMYGVTNIPLTFIIDRKGRLVAKALGPRNWGNPAAISLMRELVNESEE